MSSSTAFVYRQYKTIDNSGSGAGTQWLHALWQIYQYMFVDAAAIDGGRWKLLGSSPAAASWSTVGNIVDNSWFAFECALGRRQYQGKFQASNVAVLDEAPGTAFVLVASLSPDAGWTTKGGANGGFAGTSVPAGAHLRLGGTDISGADGSIIIHGDRDTLLIAMANNGTSAFASGCYLGRYEPFVDQITFPECLLTAWDGAGSPKGFDRSTGGVFSSAPSDSYALDATTPVPVAVAGQVFTPAWMTSARQPDPFSGQFHFRSLELAIPSSPLGFLRHVHSVAGLASLSRLDFKRKLVLHDSAMDDAIAVKHNGTTP